MNPLSIVLVIVSISFAFGILLGHWTGYWLGRIVEFFENEKREGHVPVDMGFTKWLTHK